MSEESLLEIRNVKASHFEQSDGVSEIEILKGLDLKVNLGETHAIMGPNGSGKSTLAKILAGHPDYKVTSGDIRYDYNLKQHEISSWEPEERVLKGMFMAYQYPVEIPGLSNIEFLRASYNSLCEAQGVEPMDTMDFHDHLREKLKLLDMNESFVDRSVNAGFSGGEKKRNEILQLLLLNPRLAILDETDSGLDVDSLRIVSKGVNHYHNANNSIIIITHYQRILDYIKPDYVHILYQGKIIKSGDATLAMDIEKNGYDRYISAVH